MFFPGPVKLTVKSFVAYNIDGIRKWFQLPCDKWIQGMLARDEIGYRVYIVTLKTSEASNYHNWPRVKLD